MIDGKLGREEIVGFATEFIGWEEQSWAPHSEASVAGVSQLFNSQTQQTATLRIHTSGDDEYVWIKVDGQEIFKGTLTQLSDI